MINLSQETEALAKRLAAAQSLSIDDTVRQALEERARSLGIVTPQSRVSRRLNVDEILAVGTEITAMPLLDPRSPTEIMDDLDTP